MMNKKIISFLISSLAIVACVGLGSCGEDGKKNFLEQLACEHVWDDGEITKRQTCQNEGEKTYTCEECGKTKTEKIDKLGCNEGSIVIDSAVEPTCALVGLTEGSYCCQCGAVIKAQEVIPKLDHKDEDGDEICDVCGYVTISAKDYLAKFTAEDADYTTTSDISGECIAGNVYRFTGKASVSNALKIDMRTGSDSRYFFLMTASEYAATEDGTALFIPGVHVATSGEYTYVYIPKGSTISYPSDSGSGYKTGVAWDCTISEILGEGIVRCTLK